MAGGQDGEAMRLWPSQSDPIGGMQPSESSTVPAGGDPTDHKWVAPAAEIINRTS